MAGTIFRNSSEENTSSFETLNTKETSKTRVMVSQILDGSWNNLSVSLSEWQKLKLENVGESGVRCLMDTWFNKEHSMDEGTYCNATWDNVYCWPPTPSGSIVRRPCSEIMQGTEPSAAQHILGQATRVCSENGTWLWGNWTNYTECADSYDEYVWNLQFIQEEERKLVVLVQYILFIGSILSIACLALALLIFYYFKCLRCDRVTVHIHLMIALLLRSALIIVITEPFIFNRRFHYRHVDLICKGVLSLHLYSTVASINWMFIQGVYLHGKLTTNVFDRGTPFKVYHVIGWVLPLFLVIIYATVLEIYHPVQCWKDYSERSEIWILLAPMIFALLANLLFLINIMRILLTKGQRPNASSDAVQLRRAVKATFVLFPLLGINNLLFLHNPGGEFNKYFVIFNAIFGSTQGIFVSILYCFVSKDVRAAIHRVYRRYASRRSANSISYGSSVTRHSTITSRSRSRVEFRTKLIRLPVPQSQSEIVNGNPLSCRSSPELGLGIVQEIQGNGSNSSAPSSPFSNDRCGNEVLHCNPLLLQEDEEEEEESTSQVNQYSVSIPLNELYSTVV